RSSFGAMTERVLILGATSAIALEAAKLYALRGARLHLVARNADKLQGVLARLRGSSEAEVTQETADFSDLSANAELVSRAERSLGALDTVLIAHGDLGNQLETERSFDAAEHVLRVNFMSVVSLLIPLSQRMEAARHGRICVITSVAGERGRPRNYTYGTAKAALNVYLQGLRSRLYGTGVTITTIKLGPVDTPMTVSHKKSILFAQPESVARSIVAATDLRRAEVYVPSYWRPIMSIVRNTPERLFQMLPFLSGR
ncbi:MAG TPA: SDR family NAD(P)-dependent oxidoreductase, partial [Polyangiaceae bacterium]|nr:SDR family NAD(P)-dependent oxidoreductase [Polyangiaceae bacterium]